MFSSDADVAAEAALSVAAACVDSLTVSIVAPPELPHAVRVTVSNTAAVSVLTTFLNILHPPLINGERTFSLSVNYKLLIKYIKFF